MTLPVFRSAAILGLVLATAVGSAASAAVVSLDLQKFSPGTYQTAGLAARNMALEGIRVLANEGFETQGVAREFVTLSNGNVTRTSLVTGSVGSFTATGERGTGGTVTDRPINPVRNYGRGVYLRDQVVYGRTNTTPGGRYYLDSNDTQGIRWDLALAGDRLFDTVIFTLTDVTDVGAIFSILTEGTQAVIRPRGENGTRTLVKIVFSAPLASTSLFLRNNIINDGFGIDDVTVGVAAVPLPATALLLMGGLGALAAMRRRRAGQDRLI